MTNPYNPPRTFEEFHERYPELVRMCVQRSVWNKTQWDDREQDLILGLMHKQTVERYDTGRIGGINTEGGFCAYMLRCLKNQLKTLAVKDKRDASSNVMQFSNGSNDEDDFFLYQNSDIFRRSSTLPCHLTATPDLDKFLSYVARVYPGYLRIIELLLIGATDTEIHDATGIHRQSIGSLMVRTVPVLYHHMTVGRNPGHEVLMRKTYKRLLELGDFPLVTTRQRQKKYQMERQPLTPEDDAACHGTVKRVCDNAACGRTFFRDARIIRWRLRTNIGGKIGCSNGCGQAIRRNRKKESK